MQTQSPLAMSLIQAAGGLINGNSHVATVISKVLRSRRELITNNIYLLYQTQDTLEYINRHELQTTDCDKSIPNQEWEALRNSNFLLLNPYMKTKQKISKIL